MLLRNRTKDSENETDVSLNEVSQEAKKERQYLWMARVLGLICVATLISNIVLFFALTSLTPIVRVQPFYVSTQDKNQQIVSVRRPSLETLSSRELQESFVRQYLLARYGVGSDTGELARRWSLDGMIRRMSSPTIYERFWSEEGSRYLEMAEKEGMTRGVTISRTHQHPKVERLNGVVTAVWWADIELTTMKMDTGEPVRERVTAQLEIQFGDASAGRFNWEQRWQNPLGFMVTKFKLDNQNTSMKEK